MKLKEFIKKYHIIPYIIMESVILILGFSVKWYRYEEFAVYGDALASGYRYFNFLLAYIIVMTSLLFYLLVIRRIRIAAAFLAVCLSCGILFIVLMPPDTPADEDKHMFAVTEFSNPILGIEDNDEPFLATYRECDAQSGFTRLVSMENYIRLARNFTKKAQKGNYVTYETEHFNYAKSTCVLYFPAIIGMTASKLMGLGTVMMYFISRFLMLLTYAFTGYFAIRRIPSGKALLAVIMALPTSISRAACVSQDGVLHAFSFLFMAYVFFMAFSDDAIKVKDVIVTAVSAAVLVLGKGGAYAPLLLLLFLIPGKRIKTKISYPVLAGLCILSAFIVFLVTHPGLIGDLIGSGKGTEDELLWNENRSYTLKDIITSPGHSAKMFFGTFTAHLGNFFVEMLAGGYGWLQINSSPFIVTACYILVLFSSLSEEDQQIVMNKKQRAVTLAASAGAIGLCVLSMWIFWTPVTYQYIAGVQGRYFILPFFPVMMTFRNNKFSIKTGLENKCMGIAVLITVFAVFEFWTKIAV